jgi:hypothetical protein
VLRILSIFVDVRTPLPNGESVSHINPRYASYSMLIFVGRVVSTRLLLGENLAFTKGAIENIFSIY